jgi:hypothetical protein
VTFTSAEYVNGAGQNLGVVYAQIDDIEQNGQVLTNCGISSSTEVQCYYSGNNNGEYQK